ncbi:MAG: hypothetical protein JWM77_2594 [Rhodospirillales bacterium]|nr:hypothetical protein [Rhodospirillales bacterium]
MSRSFLCGAALGLIVLALAPMPLAAEATKAAGAAVAVDASHDFDFLIGAWKSEQHKLKKRLANNTEWTGFSSELRVRKLPAGMGNIDELDMPNATGLTIRLFDPKRQLWSIYWIASNDPVMDTNPVVGRFNGPVGEFFADDEFEGKKIRVRYTWTMIDKDRASWAQAFSPDGGKSWETNWKAEFTRVSS